MHDLRGAGPVWHCGDMQCNLVVETLINPGKLSVIILKKYFQLVALFIPK